MIKNHEYIFMYLWSIEQVSWYFILQKLVFQFIITFENIVLTKEAIYIILLKKVCHKIEVNACHN